MKKLLPMLLVAGCASYSGSGLKPGATEAEVRKAMGEPAAVRKAPDGGQLLWYPRQPYGRESYAARIGPGGTLTAVEQRLTSENIRKLIPNSSSTGDVLDTLGPPYRILDIPRLERKAWEYYVQTFPLVPQLLYVQVSPDNVVREIIQIDEGSRSGFFFGFGLGF